jgi:hypothetical protein
VTRVEHVVAPPIAVPDGYTLAVVDGIAALWLDARVAVERARSIAHEIELRTMSGDAPLAILDDNGGAAFLFHPGVPLASLLEHQAKHGGAMDTPLACALLANICDRVARVHESTKLRVAALDDTRVWLGFDGVVALTGPVDVALVSPSYIELAHQLTLDVWRLGAMSAGLLSGIRPRPYDELNKPPITALTYEGVGEMPALPGEVAHLRPLVERALNSVDRSDARHLATSFGQHAAAAGLVDERDVTRQLRGVLAGLFPDECARATAFLEDIAVRSR